MNVARKTAVALVCAITLCSVFGQNATEGQNGASPKVKMTSILGVSVGMTMPQTLAELQSRSKRFHGTPQIHANEGSLSLLTNLIIPDVRLGWDGNEEMIASGVIITFYHGKVVCLMVNGLNKDDETYSKKRKWQTFLTQIPVTKKLRSELVSEEVTMINDVEGCSIDDDMLRLYDADNWNAFVDEKKKLAEFFNSISRDNEVLD